MSIDKEVYDGIRALFPRPYSMNDGVKALYTYYKEKDGPKPSIPFHAGGEKFQ